VSTCYIESKATNINQIVDELVELNRKIQTPKDKIGTIVATVKNAVGESSKAFKAFYADMQRNCKTGSSYINDFSNKLKGDSLAAKAAITKAEKSKAKAEADSVKYLKEFKETKTAIRNAHIREEKEQRHFERLLIEADNKLIVIKRVRDIVEDELLNGKAPSLVQVNTVTEKLNELKTMLEKSDDSMFATVVGALLETVSLQNLSDQGILRNILSTLKKIKVNILSWRKKAIKDNKNVRKIAAKAMAAKLKSLAALGKLIVVAKSDIVQATRNIEELKAAIAHLDHAIKRKARDLKHWNSLCDNQALIAKIFREGRKELRAHVAKVAKNLLNL